MDYDALAAENNGTVAPTPIDYDALAAQHGGEPSQQSSTLKTAAKQFALGAIPVTASLPGMGFGYAAGEFAGGAIGGAIGSVVPVVGTAAGAAVGSTIGGFVGGIAGGYETGKIGAEAQDFALKQLPDSFRKTLGIDQAQLQVDQEQHPYAAQIGGLAPFLFTARPWAAPGVTKAADTAIGRFMGDWKQKALGGAIMGAWELGQESINKDEVDWTKVAVATAFGAVFNHQNKAGQRLMQFGERPFEPRLTQSRALRAAAANEAGQTRSVTAGLFSDRYVEPGLFSVREMDPELFNPTLREISASGIMGPGNTEKTFQGLQERNPVADGVSRMLVEDEQSMLYGPQLPDEGQVGAFARRLDPELFDYRDELMSMADEARAAIDNYRKPSFDEYNDLRSQRSDLQSQLAETKNKNEQRRIKTQIRLLTEDIDSTWSRMSGEGQLDETLTNHYRELAAVNQRLREIGPEVAAVHRRAAEGLGRGDLIMEVKPFEEAPLVSSDTPGVAPELFTAAKGAEAPSAAPTSMTQAMSASGARVDIAAEKAKIIADRKRQMIEAGRPADEAQADAEMIANRFVARAGWFNGQLGSPYELYLAKSAKITKWEPSASPTDRNKVAAKSAAPAEQVTQDAASAQETMQIARQRAQDALGTPGQQVEGPFSPEPTQGSVESPSTLPGEAAPITPPTAEAQSGVQAEISLAPQEPAGPKVGDKITMNGTSYKIAEIDDNRVRLQPTKKGASEITLPRQAVDQMLGEHLADTVKPDGEKITLNGQELDPKLAEIIRSKITDQGQEAPSGKRERTPEEEAVRLKMLEAASADYGPEQAPLAPENSPLIPTAEKPIIAPENKTSANQLEAIDATDLNVDAKRFQFKSGGDEKGVIDTLKGVSEWDPMLADNITVWQDKNGKYWVADGHQRSGLARRLMENGHEPIKLNAWVLKESNGVTDAQARVIAAIKNINQGTGTSIDAAKIIREVAEVKGVKLPQFAPNSKLAKEGKALANLSPEAFGMVINDVVPTNYGAVVGRLVKDPLQQQEAIRVIAKVKDKINVNQAEIIVKDMLAQGTEMATETGSLFGEEAFASSVVLERAQIVDEAIKLLKSDKKVFKTLVSDSDRIMGHGSNVLDVEANKGRLTEDERVQEYVEKLATRAGPISDALTEVAKKYKAGEISRAAASRGFIESVKRGAGEGVAYGNDALGAQPSAAGSQPLSQEQRNVKVSRRKAIIEEVNTLLSGNKTGELTAKDSEKYIKLTKELNDINFDLEKVLDPSKIKSQRERMSSLTPETIKVAHDDLMRSKPVYDALSEAAKGVSYNADTAVDNIMLGKNTEVSPNQFYDAFAATREALRKQYGDTLTLWRAEGKQKSKPTKNWATTEEYARQFGNNVISKQIPVDNVLGVYVGAKGSYHELIVGKPPETVKYEPGVEGLDQGLIPGVNPVTDKERMAVQAEKPLQGGNQEPGGLFDQGSPDQESLFQRSGKGKQEAALGAYLKRAKEIWLKPNANPSTIIHENGHDFLEQLKEDAAHDMAPDQLRADFDTVKNWVGWKDGQADFTVKQHEKFARGFERYFYDGIAPSNELAAVFQRFSNWLRQAYQSVVGLNKPNAIPEEIRAVFDRLLTNDPSRVTVAREVERPRSVADIHETDAITADAAQAAPMADRVQAERIRAVAELPKEIQNELAAAADRAGLGGSEAGISTRASSFGGMAEGFGGSVSVAPSSSRSANDGAVSESRSEVTKESTGAPSGDGVGVVPRATVRFGERAGGQFVDKAGNIRLENLTTQESLKAAIREIAYGNDGFIEARRGVISDVEGLSLAEQIGMDGAENLVNDWVKGQAFNHEEIMALRLLIRESAADLFNKAEAVKNSGDWQTARDYAIAEERHIAIQKTLSGVTAEWGRAGRAFRDISGDMKVKAVEKLFRQNTGSTLYQITERANLLSALDSEQAVSRFVRNSQKTGFARWIQEYWINGLISGVSTHSTYMVANEMLALWKAIPETLTSATVSELARMRGKEVSASERVRFGEAWAQILGAKEGFAPALKAAKGSIKTGVTTLLPGETMRTLPGLQPGQESIKPEALDAAYTLRQIMPDTFALMRSSREAIMAYGEALKNGINGETGLGLKYSPLGSIPDVTFKGVRVAPVGTILRTPGRSIQGIHAFHRVQMYFMEINAEAFRKASAELEQGAIKPEQFAQRVSELKLNPDTEMMKRASTGATEGTMMAQGGAWTRKLSALINHTVETGPFRGVQPLKFIDPFIHIASNIINESILKRTPVGLLSEELRADLAGRNGNLAQEKAIGRMMLGTTVMIGVIGAVKEGFITGGEPSDPVEAVEWRKLHQAYSVKLGDQWYSYHRLGVLGLLMGIAADLTSVTDKLAREELTEAASALTEAFYHNIFEESFLRGPAELFRAIENHERYGPQYIRNFLSSFVPFSVGMSQWARTADPYSRRARTLTDAIKQKIPYVSQELPVRRDLWGEPIRNPTPLYIGGAVPSAIHTFQPSTDPVDMEMERVGVKKAQVDDKIRNVDLTEQQYDDFQRIAGRLTKMQLDTMVRSPKWNQLPDEVKRLRIEETFDHQREAARNLMMMKYKQIPRDAQALRMGKLMPRPSAP